MCVGTVDQALLGVGATAFAAVRRFSLMGKVLILDEVHAYDAYTSRLIVGLVREHAATGGSVILLSATMTARLKEEITVAFSLGLNGEATEETYEQAERECRLDLPYPALTMVDAGGIKATPVAKAPNAPPDKKVRLIRTEEEAADALLSVAREGGCACWIRVTADAAINTGKRLKRV